MLMKKLNIVYIKMTNICSFLNEKLKFALVKESGIFVSHFITQVSINFLFKSY